MCIKCVAIDSHTFHIPAPDDFSETTSMILEFGQSTTNVSVNISITNDVLAEGTETFQVSISLIMGTNITFDPNMTTVSIEDDDCKSLSFYST